MMNKILLMITVFSLGYVANDVVKEINVNPISNVNAEVAGMDYLMLSYDYDFKKAVENIIDESYIESVVESVVDGSWVREQIDGNCYVSSNYVYC